VTVVKKFVQSFGYAFAGIGHALRTQVNMRVHVAIAIGVVIAGVGVGLNAVEWAVIAVTIGVVWQAELFNTALEAIVDKVSPEFHALAKAAKDCAAAAVLIAAICAVGVGVALFGPRLLALLQMR
jgi:diacylglycerol kinase